MSISASTAGFEVERCTGQAELGHLDEEPVHRDADQLTPRDPDPPCEGVESGREVFVEVHGHHLRKLWAGGGVIALAGVRDRRQSGLVPQESADRYQDHCAAPALPECSRVLPGNAAFTRADNLPLRVRAGGIQLEAQMPGALRCWLRVASLHQSASPNGRSELDLWLWADASNVTRRHV
ncbi:hypothetical protein [Prescottella equi]|uniref:hypothetical protein n=1 Tax=Rhodococcus hoagii TaxID=43767 RepID=UPI00384C33F4